MLAFSALLDLLGWDHAKEGDKALNFAADFDLLGVTFNLGDMRLGILTKDSQGRHGCCPGPYLQKAGMQKPHVSGSYLAKSSLQSSTTLVTRLLWQV